MKQLFLTAVCLFTFFEFSRSEEHYLIKTLPVIPEELKEEIDLVYQSKDFLLKVGKEEYFFIHFRQDDLSPIKQYAKILDSFDQTAIIISMHHISGFRGFWHAIFF